ncbi:prepilin peptidase [Candidatus Roizmanbacteria bacterium]|nr:prepilin peptidase [Candidatus Roizmanbacteria bacterium]
MLYLFLFIFGASIGSFLNVLIDRLPNDESIMGRSHCDHCKRKLAWNDLIPILSFFILNRKCQYCKKQLSWFYPVVEFITGVMFILVWVYLPHSFLGQGLVKLPSAEYLIKFVYLGIISTLITIFFSDLKYHIIPDQTQILLFLGSLFLIPLYGKIQIVFVERVLAAILVMAPIYFLHWLTKGKGMGFGDVKLAFIIGFMFGIKAGLLVLYFAFISGAIVGMVLMLLKQRGLKSKIAFWPFMVMGIIVMLFWKDQIFALLQRVYGF